MKNTKKIKIRINGKIKLIKKNMKLSNVTEPYWDCSLSPNRLRFGPLIINILFTITFILHEK